MSDKKNSSWLCRMILLCQNWSVLFTFVTLDFWEDASNLMQNKIAHSKLLTPTIQENSICWGYRFESRVTKIFTHVCWGCWAVSFSHLLSFSCLFRIVHNNVFNHVEWVTHHESTKKQEGHLACSQPSPLMPSEQGPSSAWGSPGRCYLCVITVQAGCTPRAKCSHPLLQVTNLFSWRVHSPGRQC